MQGHAFSQRLNLPCRQSYRPFMRIGELQCGTIPSYSCKKQKKKGSQTSKTSMWKISAQYDSRNEKLELWKARASCKSKANCAFRHSTDLNLSAIWGTPSRASEAHDWGFFFFYNSARIHLNQDPRSWAGAQFKTKYRIYSSQFGKLSFFLRLMSVIKAGCSFLKFPPDACILFFLFLVKAAQCTCSILL